MTFWNELMQQPLLQYAVLTGVISSIACGTIGSYVVVKRLVFIAGGIAHGVLGGMGIAHYYDFHPRWGAMIAAIFFAFIIGLIRQYRFQREDTIIGALWAVGMATGLIFIHLKPGYSTDLMHYLFGNILIVSSLDIGIIAGLTLTIVVLVYLFNKQFLAVCFDEEYAKLQGISVQTVYFLLLCLIALTVVMLIQVVGIILVIALLSLPAAIAGQYSRSLFQMMIIGSILGILFTVSGLWISYAPDLPSSSVIILIAGISYILSAFLHENVNRLLKKSN